MYIQVWKFIRTDGDDAMIRLDDMPPEADAQMKSQLKQIAAGRNGRRDLLTVMPSAQDDDQGIKIVLSLYHHNHALFSAL